MVVAKKWTMLILFVILVPLLSAGCGSGRGQADHLRYGAGAEPETIDPRRSTSLGAAIVEAQLFEGLSSPGQGGNPLPAAAERWEVSSDGLTCVFFLRKAAKWSNGDPVTAHDFEYAWKSVLNPDFASSYAYQLFYLKNGEAYNRRQATADAVGVRARGDHVLEVRLERPTPYFLALTAFHAYYPVHRTTAAVNSRWAAEATTMVGNGPFRLTGWSHGSRMEFAPNAHYWDASSVRMKKMEFFLLESAATGLAMFESGQLDMSDTVPVSELPRLLREGKAAVHPFLGVYYYSFNVGRAPFDRVKVRQAFIRAVDRSQIAARILQGGQQPALALVPYGLPDAQPGSDFRRAGGDLFTDNDVETARRLLAEAGYPGGSGLTPVTLLYNTSESHKLLAEAVQEMWRRNLGVQVQLANQEWKVFLDTLDRRDYQVARDNWIADYGDPMTFLELFTTGNGNNVAGYSNPEYDRLVALARSEPSPAARTEAMHRAEAVLIDEAVVMPLYFYNSPVLAKPRVKGVERTPHGVVYFKHSYLE